MGERFEKLVDGTYMNKKSVIKQKNVRTDSLFYMFTI